jgi:hypothetical protein
MIAPAYQTARLCLSLQLIKTVWSVGHIAKSKNASTNKARLRVLWLEETGSYNRSERSVARRVALAIRFGSIPVAVLVLAVLACPGISRAETEDIQTRSNQVVALAVAREIRALKLAARKDVCLR